MVNPFFIIYVVDIEKTVLNW